MHTRFIMWCYSSKKYFVENQFYCQRVKWNIIKASIHSGNIWYASKKALGKNTETSRRPTFEVISGLVCKLLPMELIMNCGVLLSFEEATSLRPGQADVNAPPIAKTWNMFQRTLHYGQEVGGWNGIFQNCPPSARRWNMRRDVHFSTG